MSSSPPKSTAPGDDQSAPATKPFVPPDFVPPHPPRTSAFWLEPLGPEHNEADYRAWTSSIEHIHATPGYEDSPWPHEMSLEENAADLQMHADHFAQRVGFTYTVRDANDSDVIGCVYIYPSDDPEMDARVRSWVRASHAGLDQSLFRVVSQWLEGEWPFTRLQYATRGV